MNKIEKLIKELCHNGVEWKKLGEVCQVLRGKRLTKSQLSETAKYKVYHGGIEPIGFYDKKNRDADSVMIINVGASAGTIGYSYEDFWSSDGCFCISHSYIFCNRFLYYYLISIEHVIIAKVRHAGIPTLDSKVIENIEIPLPPLPIQTEIVRILDKFVEQQEQLERLIELRKKQYEYYREEMLKPKEGEVWETKRLGEIAEVTKLAGFEFTEYVEYSDEGKIIALRGLNVKDGKLVLDDVKYIDNSNFSKLNRSKLLKNDLLYTYVGTVGQSAIIEEDDKYYLAPNVAMIRVKSQDVLISKYLLFYLLSSKFKNSELEKLTASSSMKNITMEKIRKFNIVFPSVSKQKDIINTLVNFESSIAALTSALEASKKRYEYYRDKMMRF